MAKGDCFEVVFDLIVMPDRAEQILELLGLPPYIGERSALRAVHGTPIGRGRYNMGKRHWHAWVELTLGDDVLVIDMSNDQQIKTTRDNYYRIGTLDEEHVWRYTPKEARQAAQHAGTYGPWVDGWEEITTL